MKIDKYRFDHAYNSVYEYNENAQAYIFIGHLNERTEKQFIKDYEEVRFNEGRE